MKSVFASAAALAVAVLSASFVPACSSSDSAAAPDPNAPDLPVTSCDATKCAAGNSCLELDGDIKCRKPCTSNTDPNNSCPVDYYCTATNEPAVFPADGSCVAVTPVSASKALCEVIGTATGTRLTGYSCPTSNPTHGCVAADDSGTNYCCNVEPAETLPAPLCVKNFNPVVNPNPANQWGATCAAKDGKDNNPACDSTQGFSCYAQSPADATAYCTRYGCTSDRECAGGFGCETIDYYPDATHANATVATAHHTLSVCLRRQYGGYCTGDVDCTNIQDQPAHCAQDTNGRGFCTPECRSDANCEYEAYCVDPGVGTKVCYPRAKVIIGDGELCSPCQSDADCGADGICIQGDYTPERFCAKHSPTPCSATNNTCPAPAKAGVPTSCLYFIPESSTSDGYDPGNLTDYCVGFYSFQSDDVFGCYTPTR